MKPGYFNKGKLIMRPNSFIKVICKDAIVELVVENNIGDVVMKEEFLRASDPYKDMVKPSRRRRTAKKIKTDKEKAKG